MSYQCTISFKQLPADEVFSFFQTLKTETAKNFELIAKEFCHLSPLRGKLPKGFDIWGGDFDPGTCITQDDIKVVKDWAKDIVFKYKFFYDKDMQILGIYGIDKSLRHLFDNTTFFQNCSDQDYEFEEWDGIKAFEELVQKWKNADDQTIIKEHKKRYNDDWDPDFCSDLDYYRRSFVYDDIWDKIGWSLENDKAALYISLYGDYELAELYRFAGLVTEEFKVWVEEMKSEFNRT